MHSEGSAFLFRCLSIYFVRFSNLTFISLPSSVLTIHLSLSIKESIVPCAYFPPCLYVTASPLLKYS